MERYWVPSIFESAALRHQAGRPLLPGARRRRRRVPQRRDEAPDRPTGWVDDAFIAEHTAGFDELRAALDGAAWEDAGGATPARRAATMLALRRRCSREARTAVFVWSMGITQHASAWTTSRRIVNLALSRGASSGRDGLRADADPRALRRAGRRRDGRRTPPVLPRRAAVGAEDGRRASRELWGFDVPDGARPDRRRDASTRADRGELDVLYSIGGNFLETLPEPAYVDEALERVPLRVHQDIVVTVADACRAGRHGRACCPPQPATSSAAAAPRRPPSGASIFSPEIPGHGASARPARSGRSSWTWPRRGRPSARRSCTSRIAGHPRRDRAGRPALRRHRALREEGRCHPVGRAAAVRRRRVPRRPTASRTSRRSSRPSWCWARASS